MDRKEAIEIIIKNYPHVSNSGSKFESALRELIPELKESEDEKIRKELLEEIEFIIPHEDETDSEGLMLPSYRTRIDKYRSYLEKQKEKRNYRKLYEDIAKSEWFKKAYEGKSLGCDYEQKEQKPEVFKIPATLSVGMPKTPPAYKLDVKPAEWSEEDEDTIENILACLEMIKRDYPMDSNNIPNKNIIDECETFMKRIRPQPHWKPTREQLSALSDVLEASKGERLVLLKELYNQIKSI